MGHPIASPSDEILVAENKRLREQVSALAAENRSLAARVAVLEANQRQAAAPAAEQEQPSLSQTAPSAARPVPQRKVTQVQTGDVTYDAALGVFKRHAYSDAIDQFRYLLSHDVKPDLVDNCHYWIGEALFQLKQYDQATEEFQKVLDFAGSDKTDDARLMLGNSFAAQGKKDAARRVYGELIQQSPSSSAAKRASVKLSQLK